MEEKKRLSTKDLVIMALMIALVYLAGSIIKVPSVGGFVHIGDSMVFLSVVVLGKKRGAVASAFGMLLVDILGGYVIWAPFTFVIKGIMAYIVGAIIEKIGGENAFENFKKEYIIAFIAGGIFMIIGYFIAGTILAGLLTEKIGLIQGLAYAAKDIVGNIIQVVTGIVIAVPLSAIILSAQKKAGN
ncbi:ECF transporter S component [Clostridium vincentii]|uniref:Thiamine transporter HmpT n=1 Tax=Clostridium vincentii TaxID=52704 RepID=A0A2T0BGK7_9CLOT|nr:ECF transporter S component [Clostridium vincentii]PRR83040.1 Thiamine precursor transporter HmpT [Clostridium vincentii]